MLGITARSPPTCRESGRPTSGTRSVRTPVPRRDFVEVAESDRAPATNGSAHEPRWRPARAVETGTAGHADATLEPVGGRRGLIPVPVGSGCGDGVGVSLGVGVGAGVGVGCRGWRRCRGRRGGRRRVSASASASGVGRRCRLGSLRDDVVDRASPWRRRRPRPDSARRRSRPGRAGRTPRSGRRSTGPHRRSPGPPAVRSSVRRSGTGTVPIPAATVDVDRAAGLDRAHRPAGPARGSCRPAGRTPPGVDAG